MSIFLNREGPILPFLSVWDAAGKDPLRDRKEFECFIEMGLKCATFLPDECTDSAEMLTYIMTELSAHSLHPSWHIYTSASAPDQTTHMSEKTVFLSTLVIFTSVSNYQLL